MRLPNTLILYCVLLMTWPGESYRILGLFPLNGKSHFVMYRQLMRGLAERGHQVDVVSHFPLKEPIPNYNDVVSLAGTLPDLVNNMTLKMIHDYKEFGSDPYVISTLHGCQICELMNHPGLRELFNNPPTNPAYDLVIVEIFGANCYLAMGQHLRVPVVGLISASMFPWANDLIANPDNPSFIPNLYSSDGAAMNFWQRVTNTLTNLRVKWEFNLGKEKQTDAVKKYIAPHAPSVTDAERNVSLILVNSHFSLNGVRPFTTAVVEVGGLHIDEREAKLPSDLQKWLDDSEDGFVYVSFGSMIKIESLAETTLAAIYASLGKLAPIRVLMKIAKPKELPPGLPSNVLTLPWISQLGVLRHQNIRAFVTHGGLMGTQEAIYYGVPMIGVPFFGDQPHNIKQYSRMNVAVGIDYDEITEDKLDAAFQAVLRDPSYMKAAKRMSVLFRDRPMSAMDTAVYWIKYVIRHGGTNLRSPAMDLTWWQIALLDVYGFLLLTLVLAVWFIIFLARKLKEPFYPSHASSREFKKVK